MKIKKIKYVDKGIGLHLNEINFFDLTLLVGQSGAGKSQIIRAIRNLRDIAMGNPVNGLEWELNFEGNDKKKYIWTGAYQNKGEIYSLRKSFSLDYDEYSSRPSPPLIIQESLIKETETIINRDSDSITFQNEKTPKLNPHVSAISLLQEEDLIKPVVDSFRSIIFKDFSSKYSDDEYYIDDIEIFGRKINSIDHLKTLISSISIKLSICFIYFKEDFEKIKKAYISIFPQVEDIKYEKLLNEDLPFFYRRNPILQIKEVGVDNWIVEDQISSGMLRTFYHLGDIFLWPDNTVIIIDEFENSLGVNCLDIVTENIITEQDKLQFILTSHHPYIINNININNWKIVIRKGGNVTTHNASKFNLGSSNHDGFIKLINLLEGQN